MEAHSALSTTGEVPASELPLKETVLQYRIASCWLVLKLCFSKADAVVVVPSVRVPCVLVLTAALSLCTARQSERGSSWLHCFRICVVLLSLCWKGPQSCAEPCCHLLECHCPCGVTSGCCRGLWGDELSEQKSPWRGAGLAPVWAVPLQQGAARYPWAGTAAPVSSAVPAWWEGKHW